MLTVIIIILLPYSDLVSFPFGMKEVATKKTNRLLSFSKTRKLSISSVKENRRASTPALHMSCPAVVVATRNFSLEETNEPVSVSPENTSSHAAGFLALFNDSAKTKLESKIEERNKQRRDSIKTPEIVLSIQKLRTLFPSFPQHMIDYLVVRYDGNCAEVYEFMISRDWKPQYPCKKEFPNTTDIHFVTSYYHGLAPDRETIKDIFKFKSVGSYITYYRPDESEGEDLRFKYYLCYKNRNGDVSEKPMKIPIVAPVLIPMLGLTKSIQSPPKKCTGVIPGLAPSKSSEL